MVREQGIRSWLDLTLGWLTGSSDGSGARDTRSVQRYRNNHNKPHFVCDKMINFVYNHPVQK